MGVDVSVGATLLVRTIDFRIYLQFPSKGGQPRQMSPGFVNPGPSSASIYR